MLTVACRRWLVRGGGRVGGDIAGGDIGGRSVCRLYGRVGGLRGSGMGPEQVPLAALAVVGISAGIAVAGGRPVTQCARGAGAPPRPG